MRRALMSAVVVAIAATAIYFVVARNSAITRHPSSAIPDEVVLTFEGDPATSIAISWRTSPSVTEGRVRLRRAGATESRAIEASFEPIDSAQWTEIPNDRVIHRFSAVLTGLSPNTKYEYRIVSGADGDTADTWTAFRTAPKDPDEPFTFMALGDAQNGLEQWSTSYQAAVLRHPEVRFTLMAGDLVDRGDLRAQHDDLLYGAASAFATIPFVPVLGNHDHINGGDGLFTRLFVLPRGGPVADEHCYAFEYGGLQVVVLDSTDAASLSSQAKWLDQKLRASKARFKVVSFHHPVWSTYGARDNEDVREALMPVIDRNHVDLVLNGHDHAYARTLPVVVGEPKDGGTVYVVAFSGSKSYPLDPRPIFARAMTDTPTYQLITVSKERLIYSARTWDGNEVDHYERTK